ncbi:MAG TPA: hypothetical protein VF553_07200 [Pyrinomonadaceae bacterium]|jgi:hypothetical protein
MLDTALSAPEMADFQADFSRLLAERPTIRILIYTDDPETTDGNGSFALGQMIAHIKAHKPTFAVLDIKFKCRNSDIETHADNKLDEATLDEYDQVWFFGFHQVNRKKYTMGMLRGGPESELVEAEVLALKNWMRTDKRGGGVLMTGDHSQEPPPDALPGTNELCPDATVQDEKFLGLGRAIGRCVPRAGRLRRWKGEPTRRPQDSFNTQVSVPGVDVNDSRLQIDPTPQHLVLRHFNEEGKPTPDGQPHPLFFYKGESWIRAFPDHTHEGAVVIPDEAEFADTETWPKGKTRQPRPHVVAYGIDERNCRLLNLVAAYDGDPARVGRIVADSTWHHYLNINLTNLGPPAPEGSAADQIGQYYGNLALWLTPLSKRKEMARLMFRWLATHPSMKEELHNDVLSIGRTAYSILSRVASPCEIHELLQADVPDEYREQFETLYFKEGGFALSSFPSKEMVCGHVVNWYQQEMIRAEISEDDKEARFMDEAVVDTGFRKAFEEQATQMTQLALKAQELIRTK